MIRHIYLLALLLPLFIHGQINYIAPEPISKTAIEEQGKTGFHPIGVTMETPELEYLLTSGNDKNISIEVKGAKGLNLYFNELILSPGEELHLIGSNKRIVYTEDNIPVGSFGTDFIRGERLDIKIISENTNLLLDLTDMGVFHELPPVQASHKSDPCQVDINCKEGDPWRDEQQGVMRILIRSNGALGWCTGSLINNSMYDCIPYILTAMHCAFFLNNMSSDSDFNQYVFYFHYEKSSCTSSAFNSTQVVSGCELISKSGEDMNELGSDFMLLKLKKDVPSNINTYFNGWDLSSNNPSQGVCIHHPSGDVKKISTFTNTAAHYSFQEPNTHWQVQWSPTSNGHGVTETGSSGAPLFNDQGLIIGTLTGGTSYCSTPYSPDIFGKLNYSWKSNSNEVLEQLKPFLDPLNTGVTSLPGQSSACSLSTLELSEPEFKVYPNPGTSTIHIESFNDFNFIGLHDIKGSKLKVPVSFNGNSAMVDIIDLPSGVYHVTIWDLVSFKYVTLKVIKE